MPSSGDENLNIVRSNQSYYLNITLTRPVDEMRCRIQSEICLSHKLSLKKEIIIL
jgi:hypothetical protein